MEKKVLQGLTVNINANTDKLVEKLNDAINQAAKEFADEVAGKEKKCPLLVIELENESSVPKIIYNGKEVEGKREILFHWETDTSIPGGLTYAIEHAEKENGLTSNRIERRVKGHACD